MNSQSPRIETCNERKQLERGVQAAQQSYERDLHRLDGPQPKPTMSQEQAVQNTLKEKTELALGELRAAHERLREHRAEHGC